MKTKVTLFIGAVALVTLSFTFASEKQNAKTTHEVNKTTSSTASKLEPVGGLYADIVE